MLQNRNEHMNKYLQVLFIVIALLFAPAGGFAKQEHLVQGRTMGTTYHIKVVTGDSQSIAGLKEKIDRRLAEINQSMSTYKKDSEISRFNDFKTLNQGFQVSNDFYQVMKIAQEIFKLCEGAWDGTVHPLVDLWGFGPTERKRALPAQQAIAELLSEIGFENILILDGGELVKKRRPVTLDLSSIAKGYGVDQVADVIRKEGFQNYLVEIGGEVFASGYRADGKLWRIGINRPKTDAAINDVYEIVDLHDKAFATSGDYRNFFFIDGKRYSHIIDPRTGYPVSNGVVSVTIIADTCTFADGLATGIMVMGVEKGLALINRLEETEGLIIIEKQDGSLLPYYSSGFEVVSQR
jgi:thiamine biosynthesis lipoprotein